MSIEKTAEILKFEDNIVHVHLLMNVKKMRKNAAEKVHTTVCRVAIQTVNQKLGKQTKLNNVFLDLLLIAIPISA